MMEPFGGSLFVSSFKLSLFQMLQPNEEVKGKFLKVCFSYWSYSNYFIIRMMKFLILLFFYVH